MVKIDFVFFIYSTLITYFDSSKDKQAKTERMLNYWKYDTSTDQKQNVFYQFFSYTLKFLGCFYIWTNENDQFLFKQGEITAD